MTNTQDLIKRLCTDPAMDATTLGNEAADALEAAQAEIEREKECTALAVMQAEKLIEQRDAALSRLAALEKQEPVGAVTSTWAHWPDKDDVVAVDWVGDKAPPFGTKLYAAAGASPKVLESLSESRVVECARRLVKHADFKLGGILSADSKAKDIPSGAISHVKARHLAALRNALSDHGIGGQHD